jgi:redox-sensitive bicupin YhaK (pirin superfamily)
MEQTTMTIRPVKRVRQAQPTEEGAGVHLVRAFGNSDVDALDPFLMLDDFHSNNPADYAAGFPAHPHRGMETVTYMISGSSEHADNMGHQGRIGPGDVQWMTAGSGIIHQEMPQATTGRLQGFQIWVNLPADRKMIPPRYQEIKKEDIPVLRPADGVEVRVIAGQFDGAVGPVRELVVPIELFDVTIMPEKMFELSLPEEWSVFAYVFEGEAIFGPEKWRAGEEHLVIFGNGGKVQVRTDEDRARFLLAAGRPLREPIAWRGPVVMNTEDQLRDAFREMREGTFVKKRS